MRKVNERVEHRKMKINAEIQHGQVVWAKISKKAKLWAALIISMKKIDLVYFEDQPGKTCVWWLGNNTMSQLKNDLIFDFKSEMKEGMSNLSGQRHTSVTHAISILSSQFNFVVPKHDKIIWALVNLPIIMKGKCRQNEEFIIPNDVIKTITMTNNNIKRSIEENKERDVSPHGEKRKIDVLQISKMKNQYCIACRIASDELEINHPIFQGFLCHDCFTNGKDIILSIAKDGANDGCCICLAQKDTLVLCSFCIRAYCNGCLEFYCGEKTLEKIIDDKTWQCLACNTTVLKTSKIFPRSTKDQLRNIYNLYPANSVNNCVKEPIQEIHVMNLKDIQNNVPKALQNLEFPFKILETSYLNDNIQDNNKICAKLLVQYYPNRENYDKNKFFDLNDVMKKFFTFLQIRNKMEALQNDGKPIFWVFETSAAIKIGERKTISRFLETQPIIIGMETDDVQQRSRVFWTNITILNENIKQLTNQNIFLHKMPKHVGRRSKFDRENKDMPWCYTSVYAILKSFIENHIQL